MKLESKAGNLFFKFERVGDKIEGEFVEYCPDVQGRFGDETTLHLRTEHGAKIVRCTSKLKAIIDENLQHFVPGARVKIKFTKEIPTDKGSPMKHYDVDVDPPTGDGPREPF